MGDTQEHKLWLQGGLQGGNGNKRHHSERPGGLIGSFPERGEPLPPQLVLGLQQFTISMYTVTLIIFSLAVALIAFGYRSNRVVTVVLSFLLLPVALIYAFVRLSQVISLLRSHGHRPWISASYGFSLLSLLALIVLSLILSPRARPSGPE